MDSGRIEREKLNTFDLSYFYSFQEDTYQIIAIHQMAPHQIGRMHSVLIKYDLLYARLKYIEEIRKIGENLKI